MFVFFCCFSLLFHHTKNSTCHIVNNKYLLNECTLKTCDPWPVWLSWLEHREPIPVSHIDVSFSVSFSPTPAPPSASLSLKAVKKCPLVRIKKKKCEGKKVKWSCFEFLP